MRTKKNDKSAGGNAKPDKAGNDTKPQPWWFQHADPVARFTGWLAICTGILCFATIGLGYVAVLQWRALHNTDIHIGEQVKIATDQLKEMQSTGGQTNTLIETNKKLAEAATQSAKIAEKSMRITQRAYFQIIPKVTFEKGGKPNGVISAQNIGITPGYSVTLKTYLAVVTYPMTDLLVLPTKISKPATAVVVIKQEVIKGNPSMETALSEDVFQSIDEGKGKKLILWAILDFKDAFGCKIQRNVCFLYDGAAARANEPEICGGGRSNEKYEGDC